MKYTRFAIAILLTMTATTVGLAFQGGAQPGNISDAKLESVALAYLEVLDIQQTYKPRIEAAQDQEEARQLQQEANEEMIDAIRDREGVTLEEYNEILSAVRQNERLRQRLTSKVAEIQEEEEEGEDPGRLR